MDQQLLYYTLSNPVFSAYAYYAALVLLKLFLMAPLTARQRFLTGAIDNPEDVLNRAIVQKHPDVERVKRNHNNDVENIPAYLFLGLLYVGIGPSASIAVWHFRIFTLSRILHTVSYQIGLQPHRFLTFITGLFVCISMAVQIICATF